MANPTNPSRLSTAERMAEVGRILALGILRARQRAQGRTPPDTPTVAAETGDVSLDFTAPQRGHGRRKHRRGEGA